METTYYTLTAREIIVSGDGVEQAVGAGRRVVYARRPAQAPLTERSGKVIDLTAWRSAQAAEEREQAWPAWEDEPLEPDGKGAPRPRRDHKNQVLLGGELLATLSIIGAMAMLMIRMLGA